MKAALAAVFLLACASGEHEAESPDGEGDTSAEDIFGAIAEGANGYAEANARQREKHEEEQRKQREREREEEISDIERRLDRLER